MAQSDYEICLAKINARRLETINSIRDDMNNLGPTLKEQIDVLTASVNYCLDEASNNQTEVLDSVQAAMKLLQITKNKFLDVQKCFLRYISCN